MLLRPRTRFFRSCILGAVLLGALSSSGDANAAGPQPLSAEQVKAGFLFNFTRFTAWPDDAFSSSNAPLRLCVVQQPGVLAALASAAGRSVKDRRVSVEALTPTDNLAGCHVLYVGAESNVLARLYAGGKRPPVLTVTDQSDDGIIAFVQQDDHIAFRVMREMAAAARLSLSSQLLKLSIAVSTENHDNLP